MNKIIGTLNIDYGYNGFKPILKGTPVYKLDNERCYFEMETFKGEIHRQIFKTASLSKHINFINAKV
jgi:hypothetical protein